LPAVPVTSDADVAACRSALERLRRLQRELVERHEAERVDGLARVREAIRQLAELGSPAAVLDRAAAELGARSRLDRVLVSQVRDGLLLPHALWQRDDEVGSDGALERLRRSQVRLDYPLVEAEVTLRRQSAVVVVADSGPRSPRALADALAWEAYVVVAIALGGQTIGLLHGDATNSGRRVDALDLQVASLYADGLAGAFERAALRETLRRHREEQRLAVQWMSGRLGDAAVDDDAGVALDGASDSNLAALTQRELEVLQLLVRGRTNRAIAEDLLISEGTVKYHVKNVLRKLQATSRADAVARYLRTVDA
jgi:LuxR family transcriptional regulator, regulator of acetate metabolism